MRELFAPTADARNIEIDQDADGVLAVAKQMAGKQPHHRRHSSRISVPPREAHTTELYVSAYGVYPCRLPSADTYDHTYTDTITYMRMRPSITDLWTCPRLACG